MGDLEGWRTVMPSSASHSATDKLSRPQIEQYERQQLKEWEGSNGHWSGIGKHICAADSAETKSKIHPRFKRVGDRELGATQISIVEKVHYSLHNNRYPVCLARKRIRQTRHMTVERLRQEAHVMEKLDHEHIVKLIGTYSLRHNELYLLIWPVATCDLSCLLDDIEALRLNHGDRDDILKRFESLDLKSPGPIDNQRGAPHGVFGAATGPSPYLQQAMGCIAQATSYCHKERIRHLDLKPHNILLSPGRVYLADFGIARDVNDRDHTHTLGGPATPKWVAPERNNLEDEWSMKAADVYSLGLVFLNIATILYEATLTDFDQALGDSGPQSIAARPSRLERYYSKLKEMALTSQQVADPHSRTFAPKHIVNLISRMLSPDPKARPEARVVDTDLVELGGIEQMYHFPCCKKSSRFVTGLMDTRHAVLVEENRQLRENNQRISKRLVELEGQDETYQMRLANEVRRAGERHAKDRALLQGRLEAEQEKRKQLEAQLDEMHQGGGRPRRPTISRPGRNTNGNGPIDGLRMRAADPPGLLLTAPRHMQHFVARTFGMVDPTQAPVTTTSDRRPPEGKVSGVPTTFASAAAAVVNNSSPSPTPNIGNSALRSRTSGSKLPLYVNPTTPICSRSNTPHLKQDPSLTDSTQNSMSSSTFSRLSGGTKDSISGTNSPAAGASPLVNKEKQAIQTIADDSSDLIMSGAGLAISGILPWKGGMKKTVDGQEREHDAASVQIGGLPGALSPVSSGSAFSSPRTTKTEMNLQSSTSVRVPALPTARSWADVARKTRT